MAKVKDVIKSALRFCGEQTNMSQADDLDYLDGVDKLNQLWQVWYELGLQLSAGQFELDSVNNELNVPAWSVPAFEFNLAKLLWPLYNIGQAFPLEFEASDWENKIFTIAGPEISSVFPGNLPQGMGNWSVYRWDYYPECGPSIYPCNDDSIVTEGGVPIITEAGLP